MPSPSLLGNRWRPNVCPSELILSRYDGPNRYALEPSAAARLGTLFGFDNALTFDLTNGCAGMFTAIKIAGALIRERLVGVAMIVSGEHVTDLMRTAQKEMTGRLLSDPRFACLTLGDSGVALTLTESADDGVGFHAIDLYTAAHLLLTARQRGGARPRDVGLLISVGSGGQVGAAIYFF